MTALRLLVDGAKRVGWPQVATLKKFVDWLEPFADVWSHIRFAALAFKPGANWIARCAALEFTDNAEATWPSLLFDDVRLGQTTLPIDRLAILIEGICAGTLSERDSPIGAALSLTNRNGEGFSRMWGSIHEPRRHSDRRFLTARDAEYFYRYELQWEGDNFIPSQFETPQQATEWATEVQRTFEVASQSKLVDVSRRMGIIEHNEQLYWDRPAFVRLTAPIPLAFTSMDQTPDRTQIKISLVRGCFARAEDVVVQMEQTDDVRDQPARHAGLTSNTISFATPHAPKIAFQLAFRNRLIQREEIEIYPLLLANVRLAALTAFERADLLAAGLSQNSATVSDRDEDAFERSVAHLLGLLGFTVFWWGPHSKTPLSMPQDQADLLACSADENVFLVVDCSPMPGRVLKPAKLVQHTRQLESAMRARVGPHTPRVVPVLAVGASSQEVAQLLRDEGTSDVTLLALDHIEQTLDALRRGLSYQEATVGLPEPLQCGLAALGRYRLWPRNLV